METDDTPASHWSSMKSRLIQTTLRTLTTKPDQEAQLSRPSSEHDVEMVNPSGPVVFNKRLNVPSIGSRYSEHRSCSSRDGDQRAMSDSAFAEQGDEQLSFNNERSSDEISRRPSSVVRSNVN